MKISSTFLDVITSKTKEKLKILHIGCSVNEGINSGGYCQQTLRRTKIARYIYRTPLNYS